MKLSVIILNYRTPDLVCVCLRSLALERKIIEFRVVVVDNASGDGSMEKVGRFVESERLSPWVSLVESPVNGGFSAGNNVGMRAMEADAYLLLNSDTKVMPGTIRELVDALIERPDVGVVGPRLESEDGIPQISTFLWPRPRAELVKAAVTAPISMVFSNAVVPLGISDKPVDVEWISFAAVLIRQHVIDAIGGLDDGYFMYFEDIDYCRRARETGWSILYWPAARVVHMHGQSSPVEVLRRAKKRRPRYYYASRARYYAKFYGRFGLWRANVCWLIGRCISLFREIISPGRERASCEGEWRDNWTNGLRPLSRQ